MKTRYCMPCEEYKPYNEFPNRVSKSCSSCRALGRTAQGLNRNKNKGFNPKTAVEANRIRWSRRRAANANN